MKMKNILTFLLLSFSLFVNAQSRLEKRVYYLDCSQSMLTNNLWNRVKNNLQDAIANIEENNTEVEVVLFANDLSHNTNSKIDNCCKQTSDAEGKQKLIDFINNIPSPKSLKGGRESTYTFHDVPLIDFCTYRIDNDKDTYFYLMTDGLDEYGKKGPQVSTPSFDNYINSKWNKVTKDKNVFGFYVMLAGEDKKRKTLCNNTNYLWYIASADVNVNTIRASVETCPMFPSPITIKLEGKKNLKYVNPIISTRSTHYNITAKYENGQITLTPSIKTGVRPKDIPDSEIIKVSLSTNSGPFDNGKQYNIIVDEVLNVGIRCSKNPISLKANSNYNVRKENSFDLFATKGDLSKARKVDVWFEDSLHVFAQTKIEGNKLIVYPKLKEGVDSTYYINKFLNDSVQYFKLFYVVNSNDPFTYTDESNSIVVNFEGKWEKWLSTFISPESKTKSWFSSIISWFTSEKNSSLGTVNYYPSFLCKEDSTSKSIAKWNFIFTKDAQSITDTKVKFEFCDKTGQPLDTAQYKLFIDDSLRVGNMFEVTNNMQSVKLEVWMKPGTSTHYWWGTDEFEGNLKVIAYNNLNGINDLNICNGTLVLPWTITYKKKLNPLLLCLLIIFLSVIGAYAARKLACFLHRRCMPKFRPIGQLKFDPTILVNSHKTDVWVNNNKIATHGSVNLWINNLSNTPIREIVISAKIGTKSTYNSWYGFTSTINATLPDAISEIHIKPKRNHLAQIVVIMHKGKPINLVVDYYNRYDIENTNNYIIAHN